ncbi:MAG: hypothetical protein WCT54_00940 [Patescibacteria group bacterium]|jgi:hypothetical protein
MYSPEMKLSPENIPQLPDKDVESVRTSPSEMAPTIKMLKPEDVHGPLEAMPETLVKTVRPEAVGMEEYVEPDESITLKTDATVAREKQSLAEKAPTVRTEESVALKASEVQTFKTGETVAREDALAKARADFHESGIAASKETIRNFDQMHMEYDAIHDRVTKWLDKLDEMLAQPSPLSELAGLKDQAMKAKAQIEGQLDLEQYGIAKSESGAAPFKVEVPTDWPQLEARLNEIAETMKAGHTLREQPLPTIKEQPTANAQGPEATA